MTLNRKRAAWTGALVAAVVTAGAVGAPAQAAEGKTIKPVADKIQPKKLPASAKAKATTAAAATPKAKAEARASSQAAGVAAAGTVSLKPGEVLKSDEYIATANGFLYMQPDGNLVLDHKAGAELWASGTYGNPGAYAEFQADGNFVIYKKDVNGVKGAAVWSSTTWGNSNARLDFQDDANLVVYRKDGSAAWSTRTWEVPDHTLTGGENLDRGTWMAATNTVLAMDNRGYFAVFERSTGKVRTAAGSYSPGAYARMQKDGNFVIYSKNGGEGKGGAIWNTESWGNPGAYLAYGMDSTLVLHAADSSELGRFTSGDNEQG
ncbi:hypothetical protein ACFXA3_31800 [Streptomyces sp. NPDC059456]|uniref:hypothetical protein n=1 Tax=Streptomyces sp. NPDC059456 TaxID=3346838 RepID=UPI00368948D7